MKIVFLDIDGVLNHEQFFIERHRLGSKKEYPEGEFCPKCVANLNILCKETDSKIVLSSTWRHGRNLNNISELFKKVGISADIIGKTPHLPDQLRGNEILKWIKDNKELIKSDYYNFTEYVILDDDSDMLYWQRNNFLLIDRFVGLTMGAVFQAKKIINGGKILDSTEL